MAVANVGVGCIRRKSGPSVRVLVGAVETGAGIGSLRPSSLGRPWHSVVGLYGRAPAINPRVMASG